MTIIEVYVRYTIPPNLARHMMEVAAVGQYVVEHWRGPNVNAARITQALLLHDMGNIVKFRKPFLGELAADSAYWEGVQARFIQKYGQNAHVATATILCELGVAADVYSLVEEMGTTADGPLKAESWEAKICDYADTCVTPDGIVGFAPRLADLMRRYNLAATSAKVRAWKKNAQEVEKFVAADCAALGKKAFSEKVQEFQKIDVATNKNN